MCLRAQRRAFQNYGRAGLGERLLCEHQQGTARAVGGLAEAEPSGERNAAAVLGGSRAEVEHKSGKAARLEQQIGGAQGLIEARPGLGILFTAGDWARTFHPSFKDPSLGTPALAAHPEQMLEVYSIGGCRFGIECVAGIDPGADAALLRSPGKKRERQACPP